MTPVLFPATVSSVNISYTYLWRQRTVATNYNYFYRLAYVRLDRTNHKPFTPSTVVYGAWRRYLKIQLHCKARIVCRYALLHFTRWCAPSQEHTSLPTFTSKIQPIWGYISWRELRIEDLQHNWEIISYIQSKRFCISTLLNERLVRWYMTSFQIRKRSFSPLAKNWYFNPG